MKTMSLTEYLTAGFKLEMDTQIAVEEGTYDETTLEVDWSQIEDKYICATVYESVDLWDESFLEDFYYDLYT